MSEGKIAYEKARKKGLKTVNRHKGNGWNTTLPVLDELISREDILSEVTLGRKEIHFRKIKGTKTSGRQYAFAPDYMPILGSDTEFAGKWVNLYNAHINEGIRDPIKVYEYLNWYYVEEGNKRVSVLKYSEAIRIDATITRLIPKYNGEDRSIVIYYEFLPFYEKTKIDYFWFSNEGNFNKMYKWIKRYKWDAPEQEGNLRLLYYRFRKMYKKLGGDNLPMTTGDAFLVYLNIYPCDPKDLRLLEKNLEQLWEEIKDSGKKEKQAIELTASEMKKKTLLSGLSAMNNRQVKIAFIHAKNSVDSIWTYAHEMGRQHINQVFGESITTTSVYDVPEDDRAYEAIEQVAKEGYDIIFVTSPAFIYTTLKIALDYQHIKFLNCSENMSYKHLRTYFGRIYEPNFLVGMIAGAMSQTNQLGYVVTYPIPEVISSINAYTLGARFMNPYVKVYVKWVENSDGKGEEQRFVIDQQLEAMGADIICHQESTNLQMASDHLGSYFASNMAQGDTPDYLAKPIWHWGIFYEKIIRNIVEGSYTKMSNFLGVKERAINYWWGMEAGVVDLLYSNSKVPEPLIRSVRMLKKMIIKGTYHPFVGPIKDQNGLERVEENHTLSNENILAMNWFVEGVIGRIPSMDIEKENHPLVELFGVKKDIK